MENEKLLCVDGGVVGSGWIGARGRIVRGKTLDGVFFDREGNDMRAAKAKRILSSVEGERFTGPGHNGDVFADSRGRTWIFFHAHDSRLEKQDWRPTLLQELKWDAEGWPYFENGKAQSSQPMPEW